MKKTLLPLALVAFAAIAPSASAAKSCTAPAYPTPNGSFSSLKVTKTTCAKGSKLATDFHACRTKTGPAGRCVRKVSGYACREQRTTVGTTDQREGQLRQGQEEEAQGGQLQLSADRLTRAPPAMGEGYFGEAVAARYDEHSGGIFHLENGGIRPSPIEMRYAWPAELDLMARIAGMRLAHRWAGWGRRALHWR